MSPGSIPWQALEALAAGDLPPRDALALRARLASEPELARAFAQIESEEAALRQLEAVPLPRGLLARIQQAVEGAARVPFGPVLGLRWAAVRVAAAVLMFLGTWWMLHEGAPDLETLTRPLPAVAEVAVVNTAAPAQEPAPGTWLARFTPQVASETNPPEVPTFVLLLSGALLLLLGAVLLVRMQRPQARSRDE